MFKHRAKLNQHQRHQPCLGRQSHLSGFSGDISDDSESDNEIEEVLTTRCICT